MPQRTQGTRKKLKKLEMFMRWVFSLLETQNQLGLIVEIVSHRTDNLINKAQLFFIE